MQISGDRANCTFTRVPSEEIRIQLWAQAQWVYPQNVAKPN